MGEATRKITRDLDTRQGSHGIEAGELGVCGWPTERKPLREVESNNSGEVTEVKPGPEIHLDTIRRKSELSVRNEENAHPMTVMENDRRQSDLSVRNAEPTTAVEPDRRLSELSVRNPEPMTLMEPDRRQSELSVRSAEPTIAVEPDRRQSELSVRNSEPMTLMEPDRRQSELSVHNAEPTIAVEPDRRLSELSVRNPEPLTLKVPDRRQGALSVHNAEPTIAVEPERRLSELSVRNPEPLTLMEPDRRQSELSLHSAESMTIVEPDRRQSTVTVTEFCANQDVANTVDNMSESIGDRPLRDVLYELVSHGSKSEIVSSSERSAVELDSVSPTKTEMNITRDHKGTSCLKPKASEDNVSIAPKSHVPVAATADESTELRAGVPAGVSAELTTYVQVAWAADVTAELKLGAPVELTADVPAVLEIGVSTELNAGAPSASEMVASAPLETSAPVGSKVAASAPFKIETPVASVASVSAVSRGVAQTFPTDAPAPERSVIETAPARESEQVAAETVADRRIGKLGDKLNAWRAKAVVVPKGTALVAETPAQKATRQWQEVLQKRQAKKEEAKTEKARFIATPHPLDSASPEPNCGKSADEATAGDLVGTCAFVKCVGDRSKSQELLCLSPTSTPATSPEKEVAILSETGPLPRRSPRLQGLAVNTAPEATARRKPLDPDTPRPSAKKKERRAGSSYGEEAEQAAGKKQRAVSPCVILLEQTCGSKTGSDVSTPSAQTEQTSGKKKTTGDVTMQAKKAEHTLGRSKHNHQKPQIAEAEQKLVQKSRELSSQADPAPQTDRSTSSRSRKKKTAADGASAAEANTTPRASKRGRTSQCEYYDLAGSGKKRPRTSEGGDLCEVYERTDWARDKKLAPGMPSPKGVLANAQLFAGPPEDVGDGWVAVPMASHGEPIAKRKAVRYGRVTAQGLQHAARPAPTASGPMKGSDYLHNMSEESRAKATGEPGPRGTKRGSDVIQSATKRFRSWLEQPGL
jgi:hypothetical protein